ncbi:PE-PGRS family protein [Nocardioidaceae bacterium Broad-1]|nr:PE-PGRS family protein [Nocardioidaceae bacterium Broad-1]
MRPSSILTKTSEKVRLLAVPIAGRDTASARLRLHDLLPQLPSRYEPTILAPRDDEDLRAHDPRDFGVVYIQKEARPEVLDLARRAVVAGVPVVYDIDDDFGTWPDMDEEAMCRLATAVTVDSAGRAAALKALTGTAPVVLPCMIDLACDPARQRRHKPVGEVTTVASFGNLVSLRNTLSYMAAVPGDMNTFVIGPTDAGDEVPGLRLVPFTVEAFVTDLLSADVFILAHGQKEAPLKDNNRLIMAMSLGVPCLVSPSAAYVDVLAELDLEWLACQPDEVPDRLNRLADPKTRAEIGRICSAYAWTHYRPLLCAQRLTDVLDRVSTVSGVGEVGAR